MQGHLLTIIACIPMCAVQRRAIVTVLDAHHQDLDVTSLASDLEDVGVLTAEQCQQLASLDDKGRRHEALLYTLLAHGGPDTFHKLVECVGLRGTSTAADLQGVLVCQVIGSVCNVANHVAITTCRITYCPCSMQPPSRVWWNLLAHCPSSAVLSVRCHLRRLQVAACMLTACA